MKHIFSLFPGGPGVGLQGRDLLGELYSPRGVMKFSGVQPRQKGSAHQFNWWASYLICQLFLLLNLSVPSFSETARGVVFDDRNQNGIRDEGETGIPKVLITNQRDFVETGADGGYSIEVDEDDIIILIKPKDYNLPVDDQYLPHFYYIHKPGGSPDFSAPPAGLIQSLVSSWTGGAHKDDHYPGVAPTGPLPASIDFALMPAEPIQKFDVVVAADPQPDSPEELVYIRDDVVAEMISEPMVKQASFGITLGDVMSDHLNLYEPYNQLMAHLRKPWFHVIGNHDINFDAPTDEYSDETWHRVYGPQFYAFFHGEVLFVALDNIEWHHKSPEETTANKPAREKGIWDPRFGAAQLEWLAKLLAFHPKEHLLVLMMHVPLEVNGAGYVMDRQGLYRLLEGRKVLALCGHMHAQEQLFIGETSGFHGDPPIHQLTAATVSGGWWKGIKDERGIPTALCIDGVENGYSILSIDGSSYTTAYKAAGKPWSYQIRIDSPRGLLKKGDRVIANIFAGSERSKVIYALDGREPVGMSRTLMPDPLVSKLWEESDEGHKHSAVPPAPEVFHIWTADLPEDLSSGIHRLVVREMDQYGTLHEAASLFEVNQPGEITP